MTSFNKFRIGVSILVLTFLALSFYQIEFLWIAAVISVLFLSRVAWGAFDIRQNFFIEAQCKIKGKTLCLTFDDGPHPLYTPQILDTLKEQKIHATFFVIGSNVKQHPELTLRIIQEGHSIGNHTYSHSTSFGFMSSKKVEEELSLTNEIIKQVTGSHIKIFRPPFGVTNPQIAKVAKKLNYHTVGWSNRSLDTQISDTSKVVKRVISKLSKGDIILLHDTIPQTVDALQDIIVNAKNKGYEFGTLDN